MRLGSVIVRTNSGGILTGSVFSTKRQPTLHRNGFCWPYAPYLLPLKPSTLKTIEYLALVYMVPRAPEMVEGSLSCLTIVISGKGNKPE